MLLSMFLVGLATAPASAAPKPNGPGDRALLAPTQLRSVDHELSTDFKVQYGLHYIAGEAVWLRGYNGALMGPVLRVRPGDSLIVDMENALPGNACNEPSAGGHGGHSGACGKDTNEPHGFNTTNLHTHGLWVSPTGNSDNVLLSLYPGDTFHNEINIPSDHPPGTHWYHAHHHGSVALQVSAGLAGMLIIEGGLDEVPEIAAAREELLVFQQVAYSQADCMGEDGKDVRSPAAIEAKAGCIESYTNFGPSTWPNVKDAEGNVDKGQLRFTTINGQVQPTVFAYPGEVVRFRSVHAGVRESVHVAITPMPPKAKLLPKTLAAMDAGIIGPEGTAGQRTSAYLDTIPLLPIHEVSNDGIAFGRVDEKRSIELQPGYRSDFLVKFDKPGDYVILDAAADDLDQLRPDGGAEVTKVLGYVRVAGSRVDMKLPTTAQVAHLAPYPHVEDAELTGCQDNVFNIETARPDGQTWFTVNDKPYCPNATPRQVPLHQAEEWRLVSKLVNHPFHIHVNPFEVLPDENNQLEHPVWKDTWLVHGPVSGYAESEQELYDLVTRVRTRYRRYIGAYVLHCHILDHEDQGMMQEVEVLNHTPAGSSVSCAEPIDLGLFPGSGADRPQGEDPCAEAAPMSPATPMAPGMGH